jgi:hypothetical protein
MDPRRLLRPHGPLPPSVYWLRRAAIGLIGVGVIVLVGVLILRAIPGGPSPTAQSPAPSAPAAAAPSTPPARTSQPVTTPPATPTTTPATTAAVPACVAADLTVTVVSAERTYAAGVEPTFTATVGATGGPCRVTNGASFVVTSGPARVWGSQDCGNSGAEAVLVIPPDLVRRETWNRKRSAPACATVFGTTAAAAGTYHVVATVAGVSSAPVRFALS